MKPPTLTCCPVCERGPIEHSFSTRDLEFKVNDHEYALWQCGSCRSFFQNPLPEEAEIPAFYATSTSYGAHTAGPALDLGPIEKMRRRTWNKLTGALSTFRGEDNRIADVVRTVPHASTRTLLDVGCGSGQYTATLAQALGVAPQNVSGIDIFEGVAEFGRQRGMNFRCMRLADLGEAERFDVISMSHVLEHEREPRKMLARAHAHLNPGGRLVLSVPNARSAPARLFGSRWVGHSVPRHLFNFSKEGVMALASDHFELEAYSAAGVYVFMLGRYFHPWLEAIALRLRLPLAAVRAILYAAGAGDNQSFIFRRREKS